MRPPRRSQAEPIRAWSPREVELLRAQLSAYDSAVVSVLAYAGLRPGELLGLQWRDVQQRTLLIARSADLEARDEIRVARDQVRGRGVAPVLPETDTGPAGE